MNVESERINCAAKSDELSSCLSGCWPPPRPPPLHHCSHYRPEAFIIGSHAQSGYTTHVWYIEGQESSAASSTPPASHAPAAEQRWQQRRALVGRAEPAAHSAVFSFFRCFLLLSMRFAVAVDTRCTMADASFFASFAALTAARRLRSSAAFSLRAASAACQVGRSATAV